MLKYKDFVFPIIYKTKTFFILLNYGAFPFEKIILDLFTDSIFILLFIVLYQLYSINYQKMIHIESISFYNDTNALKYIITASL